MDDGWRIASSGDEQTDVVGESHYSSELARLVGADRERRFTASLIPEPENPYDSNAVGVYQAGGAKIGHLSRNDAASWQPLLLQIKRGFGAVVTCEAVAGGRPGGPIGVTLLMGLDDVEHELDRRRRAAAPDPPPTLSWKVRRDQQEFPAQDREQIRAWARDGNLLPSDYIFNPVLGRWMYAKDTAELAPIFAARQTNEQTSRGTSKTGIGLLIGGLIIGWVVWWPVGIFTSVVGAIVILAHAASRRRRLADLTVATDSPLSEPKPAASFLRVASAVAVVALLLVASIAYYRRTPQYSQRRIAIGADQAPNVATEMKTVPVPSLPTVTQRSPAVEMQLEPMPVETAPEGAADSPAAPATVTVPIRRIAEQVWVHGGMYYRENCDRPAGATRLPKAIAIRQGNRPAPGCYENNRPVDDR